MDTKKIGLIILSLSVIMAVIFAVFSYNVIKKIKDRVVYDESGNCIHENPDSCPFQEINRLTPSIYFGSIVIVFLAALGIYLAFFEERVKSKSEESKKSGSDKEENDEKFRILMMGLDESEQKIIKAVKEQDGISQSTLMLRVDMSKTKLSLTLKDLEGKGLIKKVGKGKINLIYLKKAI